MKGMQKQLNDAQRKLVEDHHNLIFQFMTEFGLDTNDIEDWYGICAVALCEAALEYKGGSFYQIAWRRMFERVATNEYI